MYTNIYLIYIRGLMSKRWVRILIVLVMAVGTFFLGGCAKVAYRRIMTNDGVIIDEVMIVLDKDIFNDVQAAQIYDSVKTDYQNINNTFLDWLQVNFAGKYIKHESVYQDFKQNISMNITTLQSDEKEYYFSVYFQFNSTLHFLYFYGMATEEFVQEYGLEDYGEAVGVVPDFGSFVKSMITNDYEIINSNAFVRNFQWQDTDMYSKFKSFTRETGETYIQYYVDKANLILGEDYSEADVANNIQLIQIFESTNNRYVTNADMVYADPDAIGHYIYRWDIEAGKSTTLELAKKSPRPVAWYITGIAVAAAAIVIVSMISLGQYIHSKSQKEDSNGR